MRQVITLPITDALFAISREALLPRVPGISLGIVQCLKKSVCFLQ
jgi:hypothetical protein